MKDKRIYIADMAVLMPDGLCLELPGSVSVVSEEDKARARLDTKFEKNERIACELSYTVSRLLQDCRTELIPEQTGISFGTTQGCIEFLSHCQNGINERGMKGMRPAEATNVILCGAASKIAIKENFRAFNVTGCDGTNAGIDALIYACGIIETGRAVNAIAASGDEEDGVYAAVLLSTDVHYAGCPFISSYAKGTVFGADEKKYISGVIDDALKRAGISDEDIDMIFCDGSGSLTDVLGGRFGEKKLIQADACLYGVNASRSLLQAAFALGADSGTGRVMTASLSQEGYFSCAVISFN